MDSLPAILEQAEKIDEELRFQKKLNPLAYHKLLKIQKLFHECVSKLKCLFGGNRSGKTEGIADYVIRKCLGKPKQKWWVTGETYQDSVAIQQKKIWNLLPKSEIKYGKYDEINGFTNRKLLFKNGSLITFKSYDQKREAFQSDDLDGIWLDEEPGIDIYKECRMRLIDRDGEMLISMTSVKGVTELVDEIFEGYEVIESQHAPLVNEDLPRIAEKGGTSFFFLWTPENPYINQKRVLTEAELLPRNEKKARIYGLPINLIGKIYISMNKQVHVTDIESMPEGKYTLYMVLDPHDVKPWAMIWIAVHKTGTAYVIDEYPNKKFVEMPTDDKDYADYKKIIKAKEDYIYELFNARIHRRIIDPNFGNKSVKLARRQGGQSTTTPKKELAKLGFIFKDGIDNIEDGHLAVRKLLHYVRHEKSNEITTQPKLKFCDNCHNTITGMLRYSRRDPTRTDGDVRDKTILQEKWKDFPDACRYFAMSGLGYYEEPKEEEFKRAY